MLQWVLFSAYLETVSKCIGTALPWVQQALQRARQCQSHNERQFGAVERVNNVSFEGNTQGLTQFWKTPIDWCALMWSYKCFGCWINSNKLNVSISQMEKKKGKCMWSWNKLQLVFGRRENVVFFQCNFTSTFRFFLFLLFPVWL